MGRFPEAHVAELFLDRAVEAFTDAVDLWVVRFGVGVIYVLNVQIELVGLVLDLATAFRASVVQQIGRRDRDLLDAELADGHAGVDPIAMIAADWLS